MGLTHLQAAEFLYETRLFPELDYTFKHGLTHQVAYESLLQERRRALHARIVEALEALADELRMRPFQAHCRCGLGTLYAKIGQREQARAELSEAIELYRAMDMTFWLPQAEAALAQVEGR